MSASSTSLRQPALERRLNLAAVLAQLGRNPRQAELLVNLLFGFAGHALLVVHAQQSVFVQRQAQFQRAGAQQDVVFLAAGEILHRRAVAFGGSARRSTCKPSSPYLTLALLAPFASTSCALGCFDEALQRRRARPDRSPADPDRRWSPSRAAGCPPRVIRSSPPGLGQIRESTRRPPSGRSSAETGPRSGGTARSTCSTFSSSFAPMRGSSRSFCSRQMRSSSSMLLTR